MIETVRADHAPNPFGFKFITPLALGSTLNPINSTMLSTALVPITHSLHASVAEAGWLIAGLYLTSAVAQPTMGRLADLFGPRRVYLVSLLLVAAAGVFGRLASSLIALVLVRVLLGIGTSGAYPSAMRIFRVQADRYGLKPPRIAMGILSLAAISSTAIGPLIGGLLTGAYGWHSIFTVNLPLALITALLVVLWVPKDEQQTGNFAQVVEEVDMLGIGLFTFFLLSLMIFLMNLNHPLWLALLVAAVFCPALVAHSLRRDQPFIDVRMLMQNRPLSITYLRTTAVMMIVYCIFYGFAQWLESSVGLSSARAGLMTLPLSLVAAASSLLGVRTKSLHAPFLISIGSARGQCDTALDHRRRGDVLRCSARNVLYSHTGVRLYPSFCRGDRHRRWLAADGVLSWRNGRRESSLPGVRPARNRPRLTPPGDRHGYSQRHSLCRYRLRPHDSECGVHHRS